MSNEVPSTLQELELEHKPPFYIHRLQSKSLWSNPEQPSGASLAQSIFREEREYSFWRVESADGFCKVVAGINADRGSPAKEPIPFIYLTEEDLLHLKISPQYHDDEGKCIGARQFHYNLFLDSRTSTLMCDYLVSCNRSAYKCSKGKVKNISKYLKELGCLVFDEEGSSCFCNS